MQRHIDETALQSPEAPMLCCFSSRATWHTTGNLFWPKDSTPVLLPSRSSELNPVE